MNTCNLSGRLARDALVNGNQDRALVFTLCTKYGWNEQTQKPRVAYAPCVVFNPRPEVEQALTKNGKGKHVECEGRISGSSYEVDGQTRYKTEVVVRAGSLTIINS